MCGVTLVGCSTLRSNTAAKSVWMLNCTVSTRQDVAVAAAIFLHSRIVIEGSLQVKLPTIWTDGKAQPGRSSEGEKVRREKIREGESQKKEDPGARTGRRVAKHSVFQLFVFPEGRKVGSLTRWVQRQLAREEMKTCIRLWREAHFQVYSVENCRVRTAFGRCDVETVRAVVARSTLPSQNAQSTQGSANR